MSLFMNRKMFEFAGCEPMVREVVQLELHTLVSGTCSLVVDMSCPPHLRWNDNNPIIDLVASQPGVAEAAVVIAISHHDHPRLTFRSPGCSGRELRAHEFIEANIRDIAEQQGVEIESHATVRARESKEHDVQLSTGIDDKPQPQPQRSFWQRLFGGAQ